MYHNIISSFQIIKDRHLLGILGFLLVIDLIILLCWNFVDPFHTKAKYLTTYVSIKHCTIQSFEHENAKKSPLLN